MAFLSGLGGLLGGLTDETAKIRQERFQKEQADLGLATSMLQHIIDNPNIYDPSIKAHAQEGLRDVIFEHMFPDQFKGNKANPVKKLVDQFIGQQNTSPAMAQALQQQPGVGRGNATTQVGGTSQPQQAPPAGAPLPPPMGAQAPEAGSPQAGGPPAPPWQGSNVPMVGGFANPMDVQANMDQRKLAMESQAKLDHIKSIFQTPQAQELLKNATPDQRQEFIASIMGGHVTPDQHEPPHTQESYDPATGHTSLVPLEYENGRWVPHPEKATIKGPTEAQQEFDRLASVYAADPSPSNPYKGMKQQAIAAKLYEQKQNMLIQDQKATAALKFAEAKYYDTVKDDPWSMQQVKFAFDAINNAQDMARQTLKQWESEPPEFDPATGQLKAKHVVTSSTYNDLLDGFLGSSAAAIGMTAAQVKNIAATGKPAKPDYDKPSMVSSHAAEPIHMIINHLQSPSNTGSALELKGATAPTSQWNDTNDPGHLFH